MFYFWISSENSKDIWINFKQGKIIFFIGYMLTHRKQVGNIFRYTNLNISAYSPQKLYSHFRCLMIQYFEDTGEY